jgi:adenosylcobinamide-GDP ribazoletransferase
MRDAGRAVVVAFGFLTRLPVPRVIVRDGDLTRASAVFGLVGLVVAAVGVAVRVGVAWVWGPVVGAVAGVLAITAVTGAFHEDGLADAADGLWGGWEPEQRLRIMRDSRLGTYGTIALLGCFALRFALLVPADAETYAVALLCGHVLGRSAGPALVAVLPPLHASASAAIAGPLGPVGRAVTIVVVLVPVVAAAGVLAPALVAAAGAVTAACAVALRRRLGGVTGDGIGATTVLIELAVIAVVIAARS